MKDVSTPSGIWLEQDDGTRIPIVRNCAFGRSRDNTIVITSEKVSRNHATIHVQDGGEHWLIDLGSVNGTFLNDRSVILPCRLKDGDRISIADAVFTFRHSKKPRDSCQGDTMPTIPHARSEIRWLMLADIAGFTLLSQRLDAKDLATLVGVWVRRGRETVEAHGGTMNKYLGDGYLACWRSGPKTAAAVAAAVRDLKALWKEGEPKFRIIVHHGIVSIGGAAGAGFGEEVLVGPEVNMIFRLEKFAAQAGIPFCFTTAAHAALEGLLPLKRIPGEHELKGFTGSYTFFRL